MSDVFLTDEQRMIRDLARSFTTEIVRPLADRLDPERGSIPPELIEQMGDLGFFGIVIPERYGGLGLGAFEYCLVAEELAKGWMSVASLIARGNSFYKSIPGNGPERDEKIAGMARGRYLGAAALSEPQAGSDLSSVSCRARRDGDDWIIAGNKYWCTFADGADFISVLCRVDGDCDGAAEAKRTVYVVIEKPRGTLPTGVSGSPIPKIGYHGWKTWELHFDNVRAPYYSSGDSPNRAFQSVAASLNLARAHTAARSIGLAQAALDHAIHYALEREQFGKSISAFQAIRFKFADMVTEIEAARQLMHLACRIIDAGQDGAREASMAKYFAAEMSERVTSQALQILGGAGYTTLHPIERFWRDARLTKIFEGTSEIQQRIISDSLLGKQGRT
jgi:alkylation response protein AidB-like acyl-CoA dehydrogenase